MIKVVHIIADLNFGGAGQYLFNILKNYNSKEYEVEVICHGKGQTYEKLKNETNVKVHLVSPTTTPKSFSLELFKGIYKILKEERPQIVHVHASLGGRIAAKLLDIKVVLTKHWKQNQSKKGVNKLIANLFTDRIIAISNSVATSLKEAGISEKLITTIYNGIDIEDYKKPVSKDYKKVWNIEDKKVIGMVGRLEEEKDHKTLLNGAKKLLEKRKDIVFVIVGDGSRKQELKDYTNELGIKDHVIFTGFLSDVRNAVEAFDIAVLTSKNEAFGLVLAESMVLKKPVVATNLDSIREVVGDGGVFFEVGNEDKLAFELELLLNNPTNMKRLGETGENRVFNMFDAKKMVILVEEVYSEILCEE